MRAAGADLKRVHYIEKVKVVGKTTQSERRDMQKPQQAINQFPETKLIVIDPLSNYLGDTKMLNEQEVRAVLGPLKTLAETNMVAILVVMHLNKNRDV